MPIRAHTESLPLISDHMPLHILLQARSIRYVICGFNHEKSAVSFGFRCSLYSDSRLCQNILHVTYRMGINVNEMVNCGNVMAWKNRVIEK